MRSTYENSALCDTDEPGAYGYVDAYRHAIKVSKAEGRAWRLPSIAEMEAADFSYGYYWATINGEQTIFNVEEVAIASDLIVDRQTCLLRLVREPADDDMYRSTDKRPVVVAEPDSKTLFGRLLAATY
jgi:hypothetical protein